MSPPESTCWTVIRAAAVGSPADRDELAHRYLVVVRAYLTARWRNSDLSTDLDDAVQEAFVECFRQGGAVEAAAAGGVPSFRAFLYGIIRNVARRFESKPARQGIPLPNMESSEDGQSRIFDRAWARAIMLEAAGRQKQCALALGPEAQRRVELLRLRFEENVPIREIAKQWGVPVAGLHHAYAVARQEFKAALLEVVAFHQPGTSAEVEQVAASLLLVLSLCFLENSSAKTAPCLILE